MRTLWQDLRYGARTLSKKPGFTLIAVFTLALGIGVNTALFMVFDAFVLKPLPLKDPDSIVKVSGRRLDGNRTLLFSYLDYLDYRDRNHVFEGLVAWNKTAVVLGEKPAGPVDDYSIIAGSHDYIFGQIVSGNYFSVLGAEMALGRAFSPEEDRGLGAHPVIVLSHGFWQRRFNADPSIIGKTLKLTGQPYTVIGVASREFIGTEPDAPQFWVPLMMRDQILQGWNHKLWLTDRNADSFALTGRLKPGVSRQQAQTEMNVIAEQLAHAYPERNRKIGVSLSGGATFVDLNEVTPGVPLLVAVGLILLMACANVANLLLARAASRGSEIAVRLALGASRWRVIRQLLTESVLLSALGGAAGLLLTIWTLDALYPLVMSRLPIPHELIESFALNLDPDYRIFGFALLASLIAGVAAGLAPALQASRPNLTSALKGEGSTFGQHLSQSRLRNALVVVQVAVCLTLLVAAGLLVRNLQKVRTIDTGLETANVFTISAGLQTPQKDAAREAELRRQLAARLSSLPGVKAVSMAMRNPLTGMPNRTRITLPGQARQDDQPLQANYNLVSPEYFDTLGIRLTRGRFFTEQETRANVPVVVISESTAQRFWPYEDAIGKRIGVAAKSLGGANESGANLPQFEVVGVTRDARNGWVWKKDETFIYAPLYAAPQSVERPDAYILVCTEGDTRHVMAAARGEAEAVDPNLSVTLRRVNDSLAYQLAPFEALAQVAGALGMLALLVASVGLYGVMSFMVNQRAREIGVRVALGAQSADVIRLFLKQGMKLTVIGVVFGLLGALAISRLLAVVLIDLSPFDPLAFGGVAAFLSIVALLACYLPARRATKADPLTAFRCE
jgi:putative ABC transport system permease protein